VLQAVVFELLLPAPQLAERFEQRDQRGLDGEFAIGGWGWRPSPAGRRH
jgi:hypothetical protein